MPIDFVQALEQVGDIIETVVRVMLPLGDDAASRDTVEWATRLIWEIIKGRESENVARRKLGEYLDSIGYHAPKGVCGTIIDLRTDERLNLTIKTAVNLSYGYGRWRSKQVQAILDMYPCQELYRAFDRSEHRDWPQRWRDAGGRFFSGNGGYSEGRMIAVKNEPIWEEISAFGEPYPPFDFDSGMSLRDINREEAITLGLWTEQDRIYPAQRSFERCASASVRSISPEMEQVLEETFGWTPEDGIVPGMMRNDQVVQPTALSASGEFKERLASKLRKNLAKLEEDERKRLADPLTYSTGDELLDLAEEKLAELEDPTPEQIQEIKFLVEKAVEREIDEDDDRVVAIYEAMADPAKTKLCRLAETERRVASLTKRGKAYSQIGMAEKLLAETKHITPEFANQLLALVNRAFETGAGEKYNLRARGYKILFEVYEQTGDAEKAEANRKHYLENADGFLLLENAKKEVPPAGSQIELEAGKKILDMLTKAVQRIPENHAQLHAEAYCASAETLEALGDNEHAIEYYQYALLKNPEICVKHRLDALKKTASGIDKNEEIIQQCIEVIRSEQKASLPLLQRRLRLGYTAATRIMDELESRGIVGPSKGAEPRDILIDTSTH